MNFATIPCDLDAHLAADEDEERSAATAPPEHAPLSTTGVVELLLKDREQLDRLLRDEAGQRDLLPKLLAIAMCGFVLYGLVATLMLNLARSSSGFWLPGMPAAYWDGPSAANLTLAYALGLIAANGLCLPSFYFYGLLAGVRVSLPAVAAHALKGMASGAVALVGVLPVYVAVALNVVIYADNPVLLGEYALLILTLPFLAGLWGAACLYQGFVGLADTMHERDRSRRGCLLRRLVLAWSGCYTFVTPLVIYSLWQHLARVVG